MQFHRRRRIDATIDMTPMIDTLLQLFVVFLLSMSFLASAVRLDLPQASFHQVPSETLVVVSIDAENRWYVNNELVARAELPGRLATLSPKGQRREVLLRADRTLLYEKVIDALIEMQRAGIANVALAYDGMDK